MDSTDAVQDTSGSTSGPGPVVPAKTRIADLIRNQPRQWTTLEIAEALGLKPAAVSAHCCILIQKGVLVRWKRGVVVLNTVRQPLPLTLMRALPAPVSAPPPEQLGPRLVRECFRTLPPIGSDWPVHQRVKFLRMLAHVLDVVYDMDFADQITIRELPIEALTSS